MIRSTSEMVATLDALVALKNQMATLIDGTEAMAIGRAMWAGMISKNVHPDRADETAAAFERNWREVQDSVGALQFPLRYLPEVLNEMHTEMAKANAESAERFSF